MQIIPSKHELVRSMASLSALLWLSTAHGHIAVQVRGAARLDADLAAAPMTDALDVRGQLRDELGDPIANGKLHITRDDGTPVVLKTLQPADCSETKTPDARGTHDVATDKNGRFCARVARADFPLNSPIHIIFDGSEDYRGARRDLTVDDTRAALVVDLEHFPHEFSLEKGTLEFFAKLQTMAPLVVRDVAPLWLDVQIAANETGAREPRKLQRLAMKLGSSVRIGIEAVQLGAPGPAELLLEFPGDSAFRPLRAVFPFVRTAVVSPVVREWPEVVTLGERFTIEVQARSIANSPPPGLIEVVDFDGNRGVWQLGSDGNVKVTIRTPLRPRGNTIALTYRTQISGWHDSEPIKRELTFSPPSRWSRAAWIGAALLVLGWLAWSRRRAEPGAAASRPSVTPRPYAHVELVEPAKSPNAGWTGVVVDAHEATPIPDAMVGLYRSGFVAEESLYATQSDQNGQFEIPAQPANVNCRLELRAAGYAKLALTLPPPGRVRVHLVSARRAILDRLVVWAKRRGSPFDSKAEPTPDWVAEVARTKGQPAVETWAKAVSIAAFGRDIPAAPELPELQPPPGRLERQEAKRRDQ